LAFDADAATNPLVARAAEATAKAVALEGYDVLLEGWDRMLAKGSTTRWWPSFQSNSCRCKFLGTATQLNRSRGKSILVQLEGMPTSRRRRD